MDDSHKAAFGVVVTAMLETHGQEATKARLLGYWLGLRDLELEQVERAVAKALRTASRLPTPAELRELAGETKAKDRAVGAWDEAYEAISHGAYKHLDFEDRTINAVIRNLGGWPMFCERANGADGVKWLRHEFLRTYESMAATGVDGEACAPLHGLTEVTAIGGRVVHPVPLRIECRDERIAARMTDRRSEPRTAIAEQQPMIELRKP